MEDIAKMNNQERIEYLGLEEASKYCGPYKRTTGIEYRPVCTSAAGQLYLSLLGKEYEARERGIKSPKIKTPNGEIIETKSFRNKPKRKGRKITFTRGDISCRNKLKARHTK